MKKPRHHKKEAVLAPSSTLYIRKPRGRVPLSADGNPCVWDGEYGRWLYQAGCDHFDL